MILAPEIGVNEGRESLILVMGTINLYVKAVLKHVLSEPERSGSEEDSDDGIEDETSAKLNPELVNKLLTEKNNRIEINNLKSNKRTTTTTRKKKHYSSSNTGVELLDFSGPKLITGFENWLLFYKICGQINWVGKPLYLSIVYKLIALAAMSYVALKRTIAYYELDAVRSSLKNPILIFILFLGCAAQTIQITLVFINNLTTLSPVYKILTTPKLCFLKEEVLHKLGTKSLRLYLLVGLYHTMIAYMLTYRDLNQFIKEFSLPVFVLETYGNMVYMTYVTSIFNIDLYVRAAFGHWLLALQCYLEQRFTHLHRYQRRTIRHQARQRNNGTSTETPGFRSNSPGDNRELGGKTASRSGSFMQQPLITFEEIQKNLNHMDDYLELFRDIQASCLLLISLMTFLINGSLFLLSYRLLADKVDLYHGVLFAMLGISFLIQFFFSYFGDSWLYYALSSFAQTMEDEYFTQNEDMIKTPQTIINNSDNNQLLDNQAAASSMIATHIPESSPISMDDGTSKQANSEFYKPTHHQLLLIKKKDVLFCREFLHQFENHLGSPWSKLTFVAHIHLLRAFVTLIAAQIIFDKEH